MEASLHATNGVVSPKAVLNSFGARGEMLETVPLPSKAHGHDGEVVNIFYESIWDSTYIKSREEYEALYKRSLEDPNGFWRDVAVKDFHWETEPDQEHMAFNFDVRKGRVFSEWFRGGCTNVCYNCLDRHVAAGYGDQRCLLFEGNDPGRDGMMTYAEVLHEVCRVANWLRSQGVAKGDTVSIYMPMICELPIAMLACARIGAAHSVVFGGFSAEALAGRVEGCRAKVLITCSGVMRGSKPIHLKTVADDALNRAMEAGHTVERVLVFHNTNSNKERGSFPLIPGRDAVWQDEVPMQPTECPVEWVDSEHPLFLLYTSGSTGKPKGVLHTTGGFMVYTAMTTKYYFAVHPGDVFWCTADCGWVTGHSYITYGPLLNRATCVVFEGVPTHPTPARCWQVVDKFQVKQFYTAPAAIRSLMRSGDEWVTNHSSRASLRLLGTVGEPINPEAWKWYHETETGGHMIANMPAAWPEKPGAASLPFFGVVPAVVDDKGHELHGPCEGILCIKQSWPAAIRTLFEDQDRFETVYFAPFQGFYFTGDGCRRDEDGYYWITGRVDDVINVSGHRIGTAEVESALVGHPACAEAAVVGYDHPVKGQGIWAYVTLMEGIEYSDALKKELVATVRQEIGPFAAPDVIHWAPGLPKTRSGKIMRRVLRKIAAHREHELGDTSTLADPGVVQALIELRGK
ncbi:hypothetical protein N2152v2_003725 [Parachlorella kessleri]